MISSGTEADSASRYFLMIGLLAGIVLLVLTPPFQTPDEPSHFFRAWRISEGALRPDTDGPLRGGLLPEGVVRAVQIATDDVPFHTQKHYDTAAIRQAWRIDVGSSRVFVRPAGSDRRKPISFNSASTPAVIYAVPALSIATVRLLNGGPLAAFYACRLANFAVATFLLFLAIRLTPVGAWPLAIAALLPMTQFLRVSAGPDGMITALAWLAIALVLRLAAGEYANRNVLLVAVALLFFIVTAAKPPYAPLAFASLIIPSERFGSRTKKAAFAFVLVILVLAGLEYFLVSADAARSHLHTVSQYDAGSQLDFLLGHPIRNGFAVISALASPYGYGLYIEEFVGRLGWLDTYLPLPVIFVCAAMLFLVAIWCNQAGTRLKTWQRLFLGGLFAASIAGMVAVALLYWTPVGGTSPGGLQGRYFIPMAPLLLVSLATRRAPVAESIILRTAQIVTPSVLAIAAWALARRYYW